MKQDHPNANKGDRDPALDSELEQLTTIWVASGIPDSGASTVAATVRAGPPRTVKTATNPNLARLLGTSDTSMAEFELRETLGQGGTSVVHVGIQRSLGRDVAIKVLRQDRRSDSAREALIREGRVIGSLEHPNIVPVHTIELGPDGEPRLVMKRVEGVAWRQVIDGADRLAMTSPSDETPLERNLDVLMQLSKAVHFAHTRGIVHRDLKPDNVMIDNLGDVYLLDWGLAFDVDDQDGFVIGIAGTPSYMAPEMVQPKLGRISRQTDVYLLGAILHELITGKAPHHADSVHESMRAAYLSEPLEYAPETPAELVEICRTAMARDASNRYASVEELRQAIASYLKHRESYAVTEEATSRLDLLRELLEENDVAATAVYRQFGAARFGFEQALRIWNGNGAARAGLVATLRLMAGYELDRDHVDAAEALRDDLSEIGEPDPTLEARIEDVRLRLRAQNEELAELREMEHQLDAGVGARTRSLIALALGLLLAVFSLAAGAFVRAYCPDGIAPSLYLPHAFFWVLVFIALFLLGRKTLLLNRINRQIIQMAIVIFGGGALFRLLVALIGVNILTVFPLEYAFYVLGLTIFALSQDRRLAWSAVPMVLADFAMVAWPAWTFELSGAGMMACACIIAYHWRPKDKGNPSEGSGG